MNIPESVTLPSGAKLALKDPPFENSLALLEATAKELSIVTTGLKIDINFAGDPMALAKMLAMDLPIDVLKNIVCQLVASKEWKRVLGECLNRCLYNGQAASLEAFEPRNARQDYLLVLWEVMKFNLLPFFAGLSSKSLTGAGPIGGAPK